MDNFLARHGRIVFSFFFMLAGLIAAGYSIHYNELSNNLKHLRNARSLLLTANNKITTAQKDNKSTNNTMQGFGNAQDFLLRVNAIAHENKVIILKLSPDQEQHLKYKLDIITNYYKFISFVYGLEKLDTILDDIQVRPYDNNSIPPRHAISFTIIPRNDAQPLAGSKRFDALSEQVNVIDKRNPFQRFAYSKKATTQDSAIDLTWVYRLSGISMDKNGIANEATINNRSYRIGELVDGMTITKIDRGTVSLKKNTEKRGLEKFTLTFQKNKKNRGR